MLLCIRYHKNSCGRFEKFSAWSLPSRGRGDIITGNTKYIRQYVSTKLSDSAINFKDWKPHFNCKLHNRIFMFYNKWDAFLSKLLFSWRGDLACRVPAESQRPAPLAKALLFCSHTAPLAPSGLSRPRFASNKKVKYAVIMDIWILR